MGRRSPTGRHRASVGGCHHSKFERGWRLSGQSLWRTVTLIVETAFAQVRSEPVQAENPLHSHVQSSVTSLAPKPLHFWVGLWSRDGLHVGTHHVCHAADFGGFPDFIVGGFFLFSAISKCFDGHIQSDFVAVLKAVGDCFGRRVN